MIPVPSGVRVWLAVGRTDMRKGMDGLALQVQEALGRDPHAGDLYVFRGARGDLIKIIWQASAASWAKAVPMKAATTRRPCLPA
jgi:transposase